VTNGRLPETLKSKIQNSLRLRRALGLVWQSAPGWTLASIVLLVVQGLLPLASLYLMKLVLDTTTAGLAAADRGAAFRQVAFYVALLGGATLFERLCSSIAGMVSEVQSQTVTDTVQDVLHSRSVAADLEYYESSQYYDTMHRAQAEAPYRPTHIVNGLVQLAQSCLSLGAIAGLLVAFHWSLAVVLFGAALPGVLVRLRFSQIMYEWQRRRTSTERRAWYYHWLVTNDGSAKEIRLFQLGDLFIGRYRALRRQLRRERLAISARRSATDFGVGVLATLAVYGSYAFVAYRTVQGQITLGDLVMYYQAFQRGQGFLQGVLGGLAGLYEDNLFLSNFYEFMDLQPKVVEPAQPEPVPEPMRQGITFSHVNFQYPNSQRQVLEDINLTIRPGETVALVGENGSGKTTLVKLLCRLYDPDQGTIAIDGVDLRQLATADLRQRIGVIFQDYARYHLSARENIWFGDIHQSPDNGRIEAAARQAGADQVIGDLPHAYDTVLGKWFEDGEELSMGQWQKVALARAFMRDCQIIVLDEPTSALDAKAEYEVFERFRQLAAGRTTVLISHRFSTVRMADRIFVLQDGRIIESGSHDELVRCNGNYAHLFEIQARCYR